jgi:hypothetical protein
MMRIAISLKEIALEGNACSFVRDNSTVTGRHSHASCVTSSGEY